MDEESNIGEKIIRLFSKDKKDERNIDNLERTYDSANVEVEKTKNKIKIQDNRVKNVLAIGILCLVVFLVLFERLEYHFYYYSPMRKAKTQEEREVVEKGYEVMQKEESSSLEVLIGTLAGSIFTYYFTSESKKQNSENK